MGEHVRRAACGRLVADGLAEPDWWHPQYRSQRNPDGQPLRPEALRICRSCPVQMDCYAYGRRHNLTGIWGGRRL